MSGDAFRIFVDASRARKVLLRDICLCLERHPGNQSVEIVLSTRRGDRLLKLKPTVDAFDRRLQTEIEQLIEDGTIEDG